MAFHDFYRIQSRRREVSRQPRDQNSRASYGVYDTEALQFVLRRVGYDIKRAQDQIIKAGLPSENAEILSSGM